MLTLDEHISLMKHALGKTPDSRHLLQQTFNRAGRALVNEHRWSWRAKPPVLLTLKAGEDTIKLPDDFGQAIDVQSFENTINEVVMGDVSDIMRLRAAVSYTSNVLWIAFRVGTGQATSTDGSNGEKRAQIFPTQDSDRSDINLYYLSDWMNMDLTADGATVPNIPEEWEHLLILWARKYAHDIENREQGSAPETQALNEELARLKRYDGGLQVNVGQPMHRVSSYDVTYSRPHRRIGSKS